MDNTTKTKQKSKFKSILSLAIVFCLSILTMLTFTACKWKNDDSDSGLSTVDANGNLRITSPYVEFNPYSLVNGNKVIDDNSGSFTWELMYYLSSGNNLKLKDIGFDQVYLLSNFYYDNKYENNFVYSDYSDIVPVYAHSGADVLKHFAGEDNSFSLVSGSNTLYRNNDGKTYEFETQFIPGWYALINASASDQEAGKIGTFKHVYSKSDEVNIDNISFPDFEVIVDGKYYTFQTIVNKDYLKMKNSISLKYADNKLTKNLFEDISTDHNLFTFKYRTGKSDKGGSKFVDCPVGMMDYYVSDDGTFNIRFNPRLEEGSTNRYLKVRALPNSNDDSNSQRANSLYSSTVSFEAYAVSFEAYSPNSTELNYGGLSYDEETYYFCNRKAYSYSYKNENYEAYKSLVGFFPEGKKVVVQRITPYEDDYDYALQSWTTNTKSENTNVLRNGLPSKCDYDLISNSCLEKASTINSSAFKCINANTSEYSSILYYNKNDSDASFSKLVYDYLPTTKTNGNIVDTLTVVSHSNINSCKFYANFAKVRNFLISGTFFAGDNFFTGKDQKLTDVSINLFIADNEGNYGSPITLIVNNEDKSKTIDRSELGSNISENSHLKGVTIYIDGAYFKVTGLEKDDFLIFQKEELANGTRRPYSFHSALMVRKTVEAFGTEFKALDLKIDDSFYSDRQDIGIIGTQYSEQSNLVVNLYQLTENGEADVIDGTTLKLLQDSGVSYEVIKSVNSVEDENGYITTNVIISLIMPSNATLVGYNAETLITTSTEYYGNKGSNQAKYVSFIKYNEKTTKNTYVDIDGKIVGDEDFALYYFEKISINSNSVTRNLTSEYVSYNSQIYTYDHKEIGGYMATSSDKILYFYKSGTDSSKFLINEGNNWYKLNYSLVDKSRIGISVFTDGEKTEPKIEVDNVEIEVLNATGNIYTVSTLATSYQTEMKFQPEEKDAQTVFVYYDIKQYGNDNFYISPIARQDSTTVYDAATGATKTEYSKVMYFDIVSNFDSLVSSGVIMLGSDIYSSRNENVVNFRNAMGSSIILNCYYYVKPLGNSTELSFKQYIAESTNSDQTQQVIRYYLEDGSEYSGEVYEKGSSEGSTGTSLGKVVNFYFYNEAGERIDMSVFNKVLDDYENFTGNSIKPNLSDNYTESDNAFVDNQDQSLSSFVDNTGTVRDLSKYGLAKKIYNSNMSANLTLYQVNPSTGNITTTSLYYDSATKSYHKIVGEATLSYKDGSTKKTDTFSVFDKNELKFDFKGKSSSSYLDQITITKIVEKDITTGINTTYGNDKIYLKFTQNQAQKNLIGKIECESSTITTYLNYLVTTYDVKNGDSVSTYYPVASRKLSNRTTHLIYNIQNEVSTVYNYETENHEDLYVYTSTEKVYQVVTSLVRSAQITSSNTEVAVLGKYIVTNDQDSPKIYPSFSSYLEFSEDEAFILNRNKNDEVNYYSLDYTSKNNVIEGFPGFSLLAGLPYPNPVLYFSVRHKATETPVINIALEIENAFYVEIAGTNIKTEDSNLIKDFTTYSFKDTITNLTQNDYIDNTFWVLDKSTFKPIYALVDGSADDYDFKDGSRYYKYYMFTYDEDGNRVPVELSIQNIGVNDSDNILYANTTIGANGKYYKKLYRRYTNDIGKIVYSEINYEKDVILWKTSSSSIIGAPTYDIHSYTQGLDGIIYFNSGSSFNDNIICNGLSGITSGATNKSNGRFDYSEVMISGVTYAYRTLASQINNSYNLSGYQFDKMVNILNAYDSNDAYFLTGKEAAVLVASPIVNLSDDAGNSYIYRFKEWQIYSRYNSEVLYYNRGETENSDDRYSAIMRFSADEAGYYVFFPIYERVFNIDIGTAVVDGAVNQGGGINVLYNGGDEIKAEESYEDELYFANYNKTTYQGKEGYYYGNLNGSAFLYFTGNFTKNDNPIFKIVDNVYKIDTNVNLKTNRSTINSGDLTFYFSISNGKVNMLNILSSLEAGKPGIVPMENNNGQYSFIYNDKNSGSSLKYAFENEDGFYTSDTKSCTLSEIMNYCFTSSFFYDSVTKSDIKKSVSLYYDKNARTFRSLDLNKLDKYCGDNMTFYNYVCLWNAKNNSHIFDYSSIFLVYNNNSLSDQIITEDGVNADSIVGELIATSTTNYFTVMQKVVDNPYVGDLHLSRYGSLTQGELVKDENGNIYSTQQFKTAYIDRDSYVELQAVAQNGYRFEGWYKCVYDEEGGFWYTTDEKVKNSDDIYSDEILQAYKNPTTDTYYYITDYYSVYDVKIGEGSTAKTISVYTYYYDSDKTEQAIVPDRMLDKVRGYFINTGSNSKPNYIQVYSYTGNLSEEFYYDQSFINRVDTTIYSVSEMAYVDAINFAMKDSGTITLSNEPIFQKEVVNVNNETTYRYYRVKTSGNVVVEGDKIIISTLHSNVRYVAKFIETYNEYIFAESEESSGISIEGVYYSNDDVKLDSDGNSIIRTDYNGNNRTFKNKVENDLIVTGIDSSLFRLYDDEAKTEILSEKDSSNYNNFGTYINLINGRFGSQDTVYRVNKYDSEFGGSETVEGKLNLRSMYFDVGTTVHIVVRVKADYNLTIHSLGINSKYEITPILSPTDKFVQDNQKAKAEDKIDFLYYIFKITYNRDPENEYVNYIAHPNRGENMAYDAISGNYASFYSRYISIVDNFGNNVGYTINENKTISLTETYINTLINNGIVNFDEDTKNTILESEYENVQKALYDIGIKIKNPAKLYTMGIKLKTNLTNYDTTTVYTNLDTIFDIIRLIFKEKVSSSNSPYLVKTGQRNFVNFSTIPIYNYTVQAYVIDSEGDELKYDNNNHIILPNSQKEVVLSNSIYTNAGSNGRTYIGNATKHSTDFDYISGYGSTTMKFTTRFDDIEYGINGTNKALLEDLPFAQNTIVLLQGIETAPSGNYIFAGWYEQKYDRETRKWSNLVYISNEEQTPYISLATADTVILAVYKRAVNVTFEIDESKIALQLSNGFIDSTGNAMTITRDAENDYIAKYSGKFYFDAKIEATVAPTGGYRFSSIVYNALYSEGNAVGTANTNNIDFYKYVDGSFTKADSFDSIETNKIFKMIMNLNMIIRNEDAETGSKATICDSLDLTFETKKMVLVYFEVENYKNNGNHMGYNFALVKFDGNKQTILYDSGNKLIYKKDSANNYIYYSDKSDNLIVYGYFDVDLSNKLVLVTYTKSTSVLKSIDLWYINSNNNFTTSSHSQLNSSKSININNVKYAFDICFEYEGENEIFNSAENFDLSKDNSIYYANAVIEADTKTVNIKHTYSESIADLNKAGSNVNSERVPVSSLLTFSGICYSRNNVLNTIENGSLALSANETLSFDGNAKINLSTYSNYLIINNKLYVFVGWFYHDNSSNDNYLVSYNNSISNIAPNGYYEARYVRAVAFNLPSVVDEDGNYSDVFVDGKIYPENVVIDNGITLDSNTLLNSYGQVSNVSYNTASNVFLNSESSSVNYVLVGADITFTIIPPVEKKIKSLAVLTNNNVDINYTSSQNAYFTNAFDYKIKNICSNTDANSVNISYIIERGYVVTIKQTLFNDFAMSSDGVDITSDKYIVVNYREDGERISDYMLGEFTVQSNTNVTFSNTTGTYYFIGFFINGQIVSLENGKYLTDFEKEINENVVIEARFCKYTYFAVNSYYNNGNSSVNGFKFTLTYTDPRKNSIKRVEQTGKLFKVPAGTNVTITETSGYNSNPFKFVGFDLVDPTNGNSIKSLSTKQTATISLTVDKATAYNISFEGDKLVNFVNIGAMFQIATKLRIDRNIVLSEIDESIYAPGGVMTDEFKAMLDVVVTYTDPAGETKTISLSNKDSIANIEILKSSTFFIQVVISDLLKDRYHVDKVSLTSDGIEKDFSHLNNNRYEVQTTSDYANLRFVVSIVAYKYFVVSKLLNNYPVENENIQIDYEVGEKSGSLVNQSEISFSEMENVGFTFTAKAIADGYEFIGWYNDGKKISSKPTITSNDITSADAEKITITPSILTARFVSITNVKSIRRSIDGIIDTTHDELDVKIVGNIIQNKDSLVKMLSINEMTNRELTDINILGGSQFSLYAGHTEGYILIGFKVSNGSTERFIYGDNITNYYTAITTLSENVEYIEAVYETTKKVSYNITTINPENQTPSSGGSIVDYISFYNKSNNILSFKVNLEDGYALSAVYIDNEKIDIPEGTTQIRQSLSGKTEDVNVEIVVVKQTKLNVYISVDDSADATVMKNRGIEFDKFVINLNGQQTLFSSDISQSLLTQFSLIGYSSNTLNVSYNGLTSFVANNIEYKFYGFYQYDGSSMATSVVPINIDNTVNFVSTRDISIIAKFESHKLPINVETTYSYEFINNISESPEKLSTLEGTVQNGIITRNGSDYMFVGYYARLNDIANSFSYMCISTDFNEDLSRFDGVYSNIVARFIKLVKITITNNINCVTNLISNVNTTLLGNPNDQVVKLEHTENGYVLTLPISMYADLKFESIAGYNLSDGSDLTKTNETLSFATVNSDQTYTQTASRTGYDVKVIVRNNSVIENQITLTNLQDVVTIDKNDTDTTITLAVSNGCESVMHVGVYNISDDSYDHFDITSASNNKVITLPYGSIISLSYDLAGYEVFEAFEFFSSSSVDNIIYQKYDYHVTNVSSVTITARFDKRTTATIAENDSNKGTASIKSNGRDFIFTVDANKGYKISKIYVATIENGVIGTYTELTSDSALLNSFFTSYTENITYSEPDSLNSKYVKEYSLNFSSDKNIAFKVEYMKVAVVNYKLITEAEDPDTFTCYYDETESPLTLAEINSLNFIGLVDSDKYTLFEYVYDGNVIDDSTEISLLDSDVYEINVNFIIKRYIKVIINKILEENGQYRTPDDGISVEFNGVNCPLTNGSTNYFEYKTLLGDLISSTDSNLYFDFIGYFASKTQTNVDSAISTSYATSISESDFAKLSKVNEDGKDVYVLYATFKERIQTLTITNDDPNITSLAIQFENVLTPGTTLKFVSLIDGSFSYRLLEDNSIEISYPYSIAKNDEYALKVYENSFTENNSDPILGKGEFVGVSKFYESFVNNNYYRFDNFYNENNIEIGTKYSNEYTINFSKFKAGGTIIAKTKTLNQIEYVYDLADENIIISLEVLTVENGVVKNILVATSSNKNTFGQALISYKAEQGMTIRVSVDFSAYTGSNKFSTIIANGDKQMLSKIITNINESIPTSGSVWENKLKGYVPVSKLNDGNNHFNSYAFNGKSAYNFTVTKNISFVADFYGGFENYRGFIVGSLINPTDSKWNMSIKENLTNITGKTGSGFIFVVGTDGVKYTISATYVSEQTNIPFGKNKKFDSDKTLINYSESEETTPPTYISNSFIIDYESGKLNSLDENEFGTIQTKQLNFAFQTNYYAKLHISSESITKGDINIKHDKTFDIEKIADSDVLFLTTVENGKNINVKDTLKNANYYTVTVKANFVEGYYFKGFAITSSNYDNAYNVVLLGGDTADAFGTQYNYVKHNSIDSNADGIYDYFTASVTLTGRTNIVAIYEPRVYVISLNTYKYDDTKETETERMTTEPIQASSISGSLLIERGHNSKITSISYQFSQFVGFATSDIYDGKIKYAYDTGVGVSADKANELEKNDLILHSKEVYPGIGDEKSTASKNNFYALNVERDFELIIYYTALSYDLIIDLAEIETVWSSEKEEQQAYLAYADYIRNAPGWKNPSAGTYEYTLNYGTNKRNQKDFTNKIIIENDDPYVYVINDINGTNIGYPTKVSHKKIDTNLSKVNNKLTYTTNVAVKIAKPNGANAYAEYTFHEGQGREKNNSLYVNGYDFNIPDMDEDGNPVLRNIYDFIEFDSLNVSLKPGLFEISISTEQKPYDSSQLSDYLEYDLKTGKARVRFKVVANDYGFPNVTVSVKDVSDIIKSNHIKNITVTENKQRDVEITSGTKITGFNMAVFEDKDPYNDPNFDLGSLDVNLLMTWLVSSRSVSAKVQVDNTTVDLTQTNQSKSNKLKETSNNCKNDGSYTKHLLNNDHEEIVSYQLIFVKNGYTLLNWLKEILMDYKNEYEKSGKNSLDSYVFAQAGVYYGLILGTPIGVEGEFGTVVGKTGQGLGTGATGKLLTEQDLTTILTYVWTMKLYKLCNWDLTESMLKISNERETAEKMLIQMTESITLEYRCIDVYDFYKKGINCDFYGNSVSANDLILSQCILQEHQEKQVNHKGLFGVVWTADKGFAYYKNASASFSIKDKNNSFGGAEYSNTIKTGNQGNNTERPTGTWDKIGKWFVGIVDGTGKYGGTYNRLIFTILAPSDSEFKTATNFIVTTKISSAESKRVLSAIYDYYGTIPKLNAIFAFVLESPLLKMIDGIITIVNPDQKTIFETIVNFF